MQKITSTIELKAAIQQLETNQAYEEKLLKKEFNATMESLKPINLLKNSIREVRHSPDLKGDILNAAIGLATGFLGKKILVCATNNPLKKLLGVFLQLGISGIVTMHPEGIKSACMKIVNRIFNRRQPIQDENIYNS